LKGFVLLAVRNLFVVVAAAVLENGLAFSSDCADQIRERELRAGEPVWKQEGSTSDQSWERERST
jgi:molybdopterin synthase catalytic subunit